MGGHSMRLWTLHPRYLDPRGLVALWREGLLAKAVLRGETRGYRHHPQLERFRSHRSPRLAINAYLAAVHAEATSRGYAFDRSKVGPVRRITPVSVTCGQVSHEWKHLLEKLAVRSPQQFDRLRDMVRPACHPLFRPRSGPVASWERQSPDRKTGSP
ncbi:MAG: pyrimidine dimer DNA glycosylase/endonuclease V [Rhodanobacteraceae bacterium]